MKYRLLAVLLSAALAAMAAAQSDANVPAGQAVDTCGTLVRSGNCVLFEGGGGSYYIPDTGKFKVGDAVRVVGTITACENICTAADGCIAGATLYDPAILPCGTKLPNLPADLVSSACSAVSGSLLILIILGMRFTRGRR